MDDFTEVCGGCQGCTNKVIFACNCGNPVVYLCKDCVANHLLTPTCHLFVSMNQAKELQKKSEFTINYGEVYGKYLKVKVETLRYIDKLHAFKSDLFNLKQEFASEIESVINSDIEKVDALLQDANNKLNELNTGIADFQSLEDEVLAQYQSEGLQGLIESFANTLKIDKNAVLQAIHQFIFIGNSEESAQSDQHIIKAVDKQVDSKVDLNRKDFKESKRFLFAAKKNTKEFIEYDADTNNLTTYDLSSSVTHSFNYSSTCLLPDGCVMIVGGQNPYHGETYRLDFSTNPPTCSQLSRLNFPRSSTELIVYGEYLYAFGGSSGKDSAKAEKMKWYDNGWSILSDMQEARNHFGLHREGNRIYLIGGMGNNIEYFDIQQNIFTLLPNMHSPGALFIAGTFEDYVYGVNTKHILVLTKDFRIVEALKNIHPQTVYTCSNKITRDSSFMYISQDYSIIYKFDAKIKSLTIFKVF